jgi:hypothetical protein
MRWSYGIITVPQRSSSTLKATVDNLNKAGFTTPRLFVEYDSADQPDYSQYGLPVTYRQRLFYDYISNLGNWYLSIYELYLRDPTVDRFALFEDDIEICSNCKQYLESTPYPDHGYLNLYTAANALPTKDGEPTPQGWQKSKQLGKGALALVFDRLALQALLSSHYFVDMPAAIKGWRSIDGTIVTAMRNVEWFEYTHNPSLVLHADSNSTMGHPKYAPAYEFPGTQFNAMDFRR